MSKRLSLDETKELLTLWRENGDRNALNILTMSNQALVAFLVKKYLGKGLTFEELKSAGNLGLVNAINKYDYLNRDICTFSSYISTSIENTILLELRKYNKHSHVLSFEQPLGQSKDGDELTIDDIIGTDEEALLEEVVSDIKNDILRNALESLTSKEKQIILLRYGLDDDNKKTQAEIAEIFGCSKQSISNMEKKALVKMRHPRNTRKLKDFLDE